MAAVCKERQLAALLKYGRKVGKSTIVIEMAHGERQLEALPKYGRQVGGSTIMIAMVHNDTSLHPCASVEGSGSRRSRIALGHRKGAHEWTKLSGQGEGKDKRHYHGKRGATFCRVRHT